MLLLCLSNKKKKNRNINNLIIYHHGGQNFSSCRDFVHHRMHLLKRLLRATLNGNYIFLVADSDHLNPEKGFQRQLLR